MEISTFTTVIEMLGTIAFAISGIRLAAAKSFDWFGAYMVGFATAIGGGTLRDLLIGQPVFWMGSWIYIAVTGLSLLAVIIFRQVLVKGFRTLFIFDAIGLALFVVVGIEKSLAAGYQMWVAIIMGMITGSFGGIVRDILIRELPLFFRKDIYATACLAGGIIYAIVHELGLDSIACEIICATVVIGLRVLAVRYGWSLPILHIEPESLPDDGNPKGNNKCKNTKN